MIDMIYMRNLSASR